MRRNTRVPWEMKTVSVFELPIRLRRGLYSNCRVFFYSKKDCELWMNCQGNNLNVEADEYAQHRMYRKPTYATVLCLLWQITCVWRYVPQSIKTAPQNNTSPHMKLKCNFDSIQAGPGIRFFYYQQHKLHQPPSYKPEKCWMMFFPISRWLFDFIFP